MLSGIDNDVESEGDERRKKTTDAMTPTPKPIPLCKLVELIFWREGRSRAYDLTKRSATGNFVTECICVNVERRLTAPVILTKVKTQRRVRKPRLTFWPIISSLGTAFGVEDMILRIEWCVRQVCGHCLARPRILNTSSSSISYAHQDCAHHGAPVSNDIDTQEDHRRGGLDDSHS
jgi:hypothetical protein